MQPIRHKFSGKSEILSKKESEFWWGGGSFQLFGGERGRKRERFWGIFKASNPIQLHLAIPENVLLKLKNSENADAEFTTMCPEIATLQQSILVLTPVGLNPNFVLEKVKILRKKIRFTGILKW